MISRWPDWIHAGPTTSETFCMGIKRSLIQTSPFRSTHTYRILSRFSSICSVAPASGHSMGRSASVRKTVVTMKKIRSRKAMSARDDDGMVSDAFDFRSNPPPFKAMLQPSAI